MKTMTRARKRKYISPGQLRIEELAQFFVVPEVKRTRPRTLLYKELDPKKRRREEHLVARHVPLLKTIIKQQRQKYSSIEVDELYSLGLIGLLKAVRRFDPERGFKFSSIALPFILGEWRHHIRDRGFWLKAPGYVRQRGMNARRLLDRGEAIGDVAAMFGVESDQIRLDLRATSGMGHEASADETLESHQGQLLDEGWL